MEGMSLWKFDYEFDKERLLLEAKNPIGYGPGEGINTERTYYSRGNGEAEVVDKADIQDYLEKEPFHIKLAREKLNMYVKTKEADSSYALEISKYFNELTGMRCQPKFFIYLKGLKLPWHKDVKIECSINLILTDSPDPVRFKGKEEIYTIGLLNTQTLHSVHTTKDRYLFRLSFQENTWQEVKNALEVRL
jgi:hypothetical protein